MQALCIAVILGLANNVFAGFLHGGGAAILQPAAPTGVAVGTAYPANLAYRPARAAQLVQQAARPVTVARPAVSVATAPAATVTYQQPAQVAFRGLLGGAAPAATFLSHAPAVTQVRRAFVQQAPVRVNVVQPVSYAAQAPFPAVGQTLIGPAPGGGVHVKHIVPATTAQQPFRQYVAAAPAPAAVVQQAPVHVKHIVSAPAPTFVQQAPVVRQVAVAAPTTTFVQQTPVLRQVAVPAPAVVHQPPVHVKQVFSAPAPAAFVQSVPLARQFAVQAPTRALLQQAPVHIKHIVQAPAPAVVQHAAPVFSAPRVTVAAAQHPAFGFRQVTVPGPAVSYRTAAAAAPVATFGAGLGFGHTIAAAPAQVHVKQLVSAPVAPAATTFVQQAPAVSVRHLAVAAPAAPAFAPRVTVAAPAPTLVQPALPAFAAPRVTVTAQAPVHYKQFVSAPAPTATVVQHAAPALSYRTAAVAAPVATFGAGLGFGHTLAAPAVVHHAAPALSVAAPTPPAFRPLALPAPTVLQHAAPAVAYRSAAVAAPLATFGAGLGFGHTLAAPALAAPAPVHVRQFLSAQHQTVVHHAASAFATPRYSVAAPAPTVLQQAAPVFTPPRVAVAAPAPAVIHHAAPTVAYRSAALAAPVATFGAGLGFGHTLAAPALPATAPVHVKQFVSAPAPTVVHHAAPAYTAPRFTVAAPAAPVFAVPRVRVTAPTSAVVHHSAPAVAYRSAALAAPVATFGAGLGFGHTLAAPAFTAPAPVHVRQFVSAPVPAVVHHAAPRFAAPAAPVFAAPRVTVTAPAPAVLHHAAPAVAYRTAALAAPVAMFGAGLGFGHTLAAPAFAAPAPVHVKQFVSAPAPTVVHHATPAYAAPRFTVAAPAAPVYATARVPVAAPVPTVVHHAAPAVAYRTAAHTAPVATFGAGLGFGHTLAAPALRAPAQVNVRHFVSAPAPAVVHHATPAYTAPRFTVAAPAAPVFAAPRVTVAAPAPTVVHHAAPAVAYRTAALATPVPTLGARLGSGHTLAAPAFVAPAPVHVKQFVSAPAPNTPAAPVFTAPRVTVTAPAPAVVHHAAPAVAYRTAALAAPVAMFGAGLGFGHTLAAPAFAAPAPVQVRQVVAAPAPAVVHHAAPTFAAPAAPVFTAPRVTVTAPAPAVVHHAAPAVAYRTAALAAPVAMFGAGLGFGHTLAAPAFAAPAPVQVRQVVAAPAPAVVHHAAPTFAAPAAPVFTAPRVTVTAPAPAVVHHAAPAVAYRTAALAAPVAMFGAGLGFGHTLAAPAFAAPAPVQHQQLSITPPPPSLIALRALDAPGAHVGAGSRLRPHLALQAFAAPATVQLDRSWMPPLQRSFPMLHLHLQPLLPPDSCPELNCQPPPAPAVEITPPPPRLSLGFGHTLGCSSVRSPSAREPCQPVSLPERTVTASTAVVHHAAPAVHRVCQSLVLLQATAVVQQAPLVRQIVAAPARAVVHHAPAAPVFSVPQVTVAAPAPAVVHHAAPAVSYRTAALAAPLATFGAGLGFGHTLAAPAFAASPASLHVKQFLSAPAPAATVVRQAPVFSAPQLTVAAAPAVVHQATPAVVQSAAPAVAYRTAALSAPLATFGAGLGFGNRADSAAAVVHHASTVTAPVPQVEHIVSAPAPSVYAAPAVAQAPAISVAHAPAPAVVQAAPVVHHVKQFVSAPAVAATARAFAAAPTLVHAAPAANLVAYRTAALGAPLATYGAGIGLGHTLAAPAVPHIKHIISAPAAAPAAVVHQAPVVQQSHAEAPATFVQQTPFVQAAPSVVAYRQAALTAPLNMFGAGLGFGHTFAAPSTGAALFHHATPAVHHVKNIIAAAPAFAPAAPAVAVAHAPAPAVVQHVAAAAPQVVAYKTAAVSAPVATFGTGLSFGHTLGAPAFLQAPASVPHVKTIVQHAPAAAVQQAAPVTVVQEQPTLVHDAAPATVAVHHAAPAAAVVHHATPAAAVVHHATPAAAVVDPLSLDLSYKKLFAAGLGMGQTISYGNGLDEEPGWETKYIELLRKRKK
nr:proline-rich protein 36-like [Rhipicephalus microplus]